MAKMQVKVFCGEKTRIINTLRTSTYNELLALAMAELEVKEKVENCRLRSYNVPNQTMQETYTGKEKMTLEEIRIYPQKTLVLEMKKDSDTFEEYDPLNMQIKINVWRKNMVAFDEVSLKPTYLTVKKTEKMDSLKNIISAITKIAKERLTYLYIYMIIFCIELVKSFLWAIYIVWK